MLSSTKPKVTIHDIAIESGVATSTVSRALKNSRSISLSVKEKVWEAAKKLGYSTASVLDEPKTIVFIIPELHNHFYNDILATFQSKFRFDDYLISVYCSYNSLETEKKIVSELDLNHICCLVISQSMNADGHEHFVRLEEKGIPVIMFNRVDYEYKCPKFLVDNYNDSFLAVNHLISAGYKRIAIAAKHYNCPIYKERIQAYKDVLTDNDIAFIPELIVYSELTSEDTYNVISRFLSLKLRPDAIILPNYLAALQAIFIAKMKNINIPEQLAVFSFDEEPYCKLSSPSISSVKRPLKEMGAAMAKLVRKIVSKEKYDKEDVKIFSSNLIIRGSSLNINP